MTAAVEGVEEFSFCVTGKIKAKCAQLLLNPVGLLRRFAMIVCGSYRWESGQLPQCT